MLLQAISCLLGSANITETEKKESLRTLEAGVRDDMHRTEELFNLTDNDALMECAIYRLKSLTAYQEFLLRAIREDEQQNTEGFIVEAVQPHTTREEGIIL